MNSKYLKKLKERRIKSMTPKSKLSKKFKEKTIPVTFSMAEKLRRYLEKCSAKKLSKAKAKEKDNKVEKENTEKKEQMKESNLTNLKKKLLLERGIKIIKENQRKLRESGCKIRIREDEGNTDNVTNNSTQNNDKVDLDSLNPDIINGIKNIETIVKALADLLNLNDSDNSLKGDTESQIPPVEGSTLEDENKEETNNTDTNTNNNNTNSDNNNDVNKDKMNESLDWEIKKLKGMGTWKQLKKDAQIGKDANIEIDEKNIAEIKGFKGVRGKDEGGEDEILQRVVKKYQEKKSFSLDELIKKGLIG